MTPTWRKATEAFCAQCEVNRIFAPSRLGGLVCTRCHTRLPALSKYGNVPQMNPHTGRLHQSKAEANHASTIYALEQAGKIRDVRGLYRQDQQESFALAVYATKEVEDLMGFVDRRCPSNPVAQELLDKLRKSRIKVARYQADFTFTDENGMRHVQDVKGYRTATYTMKRALMLACHGLEIEEIQAKRKGRR